jgi:RNA polymerase primary sigma factor
MLDGFDDEAVRTPDEDEGFAVQAVAELELDDDTADLDVVDGADAEAPVKLDDEELMSLGEDGESWSDDPVRMYLTQMGEIPLLTRQQEIALAKRIEIARR